MRVFEREVPKNEAHLLRVVLEQHLDGRRGGFALRALEVAVFDDDHGRVLRSESVVSGLNGYREIVAGLIHLRSMPRSGRDDQPTMP